MTLYEEILDTIDERPVDDIRLGVRYTGVQVGERAGLAYTMSAGCDAPKDVGRL